MGGRRGYTTQQNNADWIEGVLPRMNGARAADGSGGADTKSWLHR